MGHAGVLGMASQCASVRGRTDQRWGMTADEAIAIAHLSILNTISRGLRPRRKTHICDAQKMYLARVRQTNDLNNCSFTPALVVVGCICLFLYLFLSQVAAVVVSFRQLFVCCVFGWLSIGFVGCFGFLCYIV